VTQPARAFHCGTAYCYVNANILVACGGHCQCLAVEMRPAVPVCETLGYSPVADAPAAAIPAGHKGRLYVKLRRMKRAGKLPKKAPYKVQVLDRAINILEFIGKQGSGEAALPELSAAMKLHKTTTHRIAQVLESRGLLRRGPDSTRYRLGLRLYDLGCHALDNVNIRDEARPLMTRVAFEVGETVHLALLDRAEVLYIERIEAQRSLTMGSKLGARNPVYCTSLGKSILAYSPELEVDQILAVCRMEARTRNTITNVLALKRELERIRERGYAIDDEEIEDGIRCVAAPILNSTGRPVAAMSISGPSSRITPDRFHIIGKAVLKAAREISNRIGYQAMPSVVFSQDYPAVKLRKRRRQANSR
jgi:IclR family transcriptional regulator, KDG regulon repressor